MIGEEINATTVDECGLLGDRQFAVIDAETGKVAAAKYPRKWGNLFDLHATYLEPPKAGSKLQAVRLMLPDGTSVTSDHPEVAGILWAALGREVALGQGHARGAIRATAESTGPTSS